MALKYAKNLETCYMYLIYGAFNIKSFRIFFKVYLNGNSQWWLMEEPTLKAQNGSLKIVVAQRYSHNMCTIESLLQSLKNKTVYTTLILTGVKLILLNLTIQYKQASYIQLVSSSHNLQEKRRNLYIFCIHQSSPQQNVTKFTYKIGLVCSVK